MDDFTRKLVRVAVAQTCLNVGWSSIHTTPLEILTDLLCDYIRGLCKRTNNYAFLFNQNEPNLDHLGLAFQDLGISIPELEEYVNYFDNNNAPEVPQYPIPKESNLNFLKPGSREVVTRPVHVHEHLPPMYPHLEEQDSSGSQKLAGASSPPPSEPSGAVSTETVSSSPGSSVKRRGGEIVPGESFAARRARALADEETRTLREISSVMMTTSGFLSHAREGKLPEVRGVLIEPEPEEVPSPPHPEPPVPEVKSEPQQPPPVEAKPEKKKKKKSHDPSKKLEKDNKNKEESSVMVSSVPGSSKSTMRSLPDDSQVKKLATVKETSKLKALKPGATKAIALTADSTPSPKSEKKNKAKRPNSPAAAFAGLTPLGVPKTKIPKIDKQQVKERIIVDDSASDAFPDIKLTAEPDKQKLNIFKKITKVKEDHDEVKVEVDDHEAKVFKDDVLGEIFRKAAAAAENVKVEKGADMAVDVVDLHSPTAFASMSFGDDVMPGTLTTPRTPDIPKNLNDHKKKKREKHKEKKERERFTLNSSPVSSRTGDDVLPTKPKTPEVVVDSPEDHMPYPFLGYLSGPLIPPNLASNPLIPQAIPFGPRIPPPVALSLPVQVKDVPPVVKTPAVVRVPTPPPVVTSAEPTVSPVKKKEKKDKKSKEKLKKKKDKKEKIKAKDKSEKKKLKLLKKQKIEEKKMKREKKDRKKETQNQEEKRGDSPSVPKITFKLGPEPQREQSPNPKITIKPLVKKEEDVPEVPKKHVETPQPSAKHHKGSSKSKSSGGGSDVSYQKLESPHFTMAAPPLAASAPAVPKEEPEVSEANQLWICPACGRPDDGSPMIACDACDMWYHYVCVGIQEAPESDWFCQGCINKKPDLADKKKKHKKKK